MSLADQLRETGRRIRDRIDSPGVKRTQKYVRRVIVVVIVSLIIYQLYDIGLSEVMRSLPKVPLFYMIFVFLYLSLPTAEILIYRQVWKLPRRKLFRAFLTKRVYNEEVMGYSGEAYLFMWARNHLEKGDVEVMKNVRDNNILSAATSTLVAFTLVGVLVFFDVIELDMLFGNVNLIYVATGIVVAVAFAVVAVQFRNYLFSLPLRKSLVIFSIYMGRFLIHHGLMIVQWAVVIPDTPLSIWFLFLSIVIIVNRIPFLPSRDLVFMWLGVELSRMLNMATASVAGMLLVSSALRKGANLVLFLYFTYYSKEPEIEELRNKP